jgi:hypothetical protein
MHEVPAGPLFALGGDVDRIQVCIRAVAQDLEPDELSRSLGVQPTFAARKGERGFINGREVKQRIGVWYFEFNGAPEEWTLADAIVALLAQLPSDIGIWDNLALKHTLDVFCGVFVRSPNRGFSLPPDILRQLSDRHLELNVDIYSASDRSEKAT